MEKNDSQSLKRSHRKFIYSQELLNAEDFKILEIFLDTCYRERTSKGVSAHKQILKYFIQDNTPIKGADVAVKMNITFPLYFYSLFCGINKSFLDNSIPYRISATKKWKHNTDVFEREYRIFKVSEILKQN